VKEMEQTIKVEGMHCKSCELIITEAILEIEGVQRAEANSKNGLVQVSYKDGEMLEKIKKAIENEGYKVIS
jgi:copper chaperone